jgi:hypothetical protein
MLNNIIVTHGVMKGYGGPDVYWCRGRWENKLLWAIEQTSEYDVAVVGERERVKWARRTASDTNRQHDAFYLCANCGNPITGSVTHCLDKLWCNKPECRATLDMACAALQSQGGEG